MTDYEWASSTAGPDERDPRVASLIALYWRKNVTVMTMLLVVWAAAGLGAGVLWADALSGIAIGGFPLGFWFAQQGSILVFVLLVLTYAIVMNRLDKAHHEDLKGLADGKDEAGRAS